MFWATHQFISLVLVISWPFIFFGAACFLEWLDEKSDRFHRIMHGASDVFGFGYSDRKRR